MFGGAGANMPSDDDPEAMKQLEQQAAAMGMSVAEYQLGVNARIRLTETLDKVELISGDDQVKIVRDGHNPAKTLTVTITEAGKALGKDEVNKKLKAALQDSADQSKKERASAQKDMMEYISTEMKKLGSSK